MNTVRFDDLDSWEDLGLVLNAKTVGEASPRTETVEVPGMDGALDLSEFFGEVVFDNRELEFDFSTFDKSQAAYRTVQNLLHGRRCRVVLSEDEDFYFVGRVTVGDFEIDEGIGVFSVTVDAEPYRYKLHPTEVRLDVAGTKTATFRNLRKRVVPIFELSAPMKIAQGEKSWSVSAGTWSDSSLAFGAGTNELAFDGTGTVRVTYQERGL